MDENTMEGGAPPEMKPPGPPAAGMKTPSSPDEAASMVEEAKAAGKLKPLEDLMQEEGWDLDAGTALILAQKTQAPGTQGKSPAELADMMRQDPSIYEDLLQLRPGGVLDDLEKNGTSGRQKAREAEADESAETEMKHYMEKSKTLSGADPRKGAEEMKRMGVKKPDDLKGAAKTDFFSKVAK